MLHGSRQLQIGKLLLLAYRQQYEGETGFELLMAFDDDQFKGSEQISLSKALADSVLAKLATAVAEKTGDWVLYFGGDYYEFFIRFRGAKGPWAVEFSGQLDGFAATLSFSERTEIASVEAMHECLASAWYPETRRLAGIGAGETATGPALGEFVQVPAGEFVLGQPEAEVKVALDAFEIGKYPVTYEQFAYFVENSGYPCDPVAINVESNRRGYPAVYVSWYDAVAYCKWASRLTGTTIRLPTDAEWEVAARGTEGNLYPWGDALPSVAHCSFGERFHGSTPVGRFSPVGDSPFGASDMAGNVWEWCADWYWTKPPRAFDNPQGPPEGTYRTLRGGSWRDPIYALVTTHRYGRMPRTRSDDIGFRCVRSVLLPSQE